MKFFKAFFVVLLFIGAVLIMISVFVPEVDGTLETEIDRPSISVFAGMMNLEQMPLWVDGLERVEQESGFLAMPGSEFKLYYMGKETQTVLTMEVLEMVPLRSLKIKLYDDMIEYVISMEFTGEARKTRINTYVQIKGKGFVSRAFLPLMKSAIMHTGEENLIAFKNLQEQ